MHGCASIELSRLYNKGRLGIICVYIKFSAANVMTLCLDRVVCVFFWQIA